MEVDLQQLMLESGILTLELIYPVEEVLDGSKPAKTGTGVPTLTLCRSAEGLAGKPVT